MKKLLPLIMLLSILSSCATLDRARVTEYWIADFRPYLEKDFMFTPHEYRGDYLLIATVRLVIYPAKKKIKEGEEKGIYLLRESEMTDIYREVILPSEALEVMYEYALSLGANGLSEYKYDRDIITGVITMSGYAIYRK